MAAKEAFCVLFVCFFALGSAIKDCGLDRDCDTWSDQSCCSDGVCRETCHNCTYDYQCGTDEVCCENDCLSKCTQTLWTKVAIASVSVVMMVYYVIIKHIRTCANCHQSPGAQPGYKPFESITDLDTSSTQKMQKYPPPGDYNQPSPGYTQTSPCYPQPQTQYPPPQAQYQSQNPISAGQRPTAPPPYSNPPPSYPSYPQLQA